MPADFLEALAVAAAHYLPEHEFSAMPADLPQTKYTGNKPYTGKLPTGTVGRKVALPPPPLIHGTDAAGYRTSFAPTGGATKAAADPYTGTFGPKPPPPPEMVRLKEPSHSDFQVPFPADAHREHLSGLASIAKSNPAALHRDDHAALLRHFSTQANRFSDRVKRGEKVWQGEADHFQDASRSLSNHMTRQQQFSRRSTPEEIAANEAEPTHIRRLKMPDHKDFHSGYSYGETFHGHVNDMADLAVADPSRIHPDDHPALHHYFGKNLHIKRMGQASKILREHAAKSAESAKKPSPQKPNYRVTFSREETATEFARKAKPAAGQKSMFGDDDDEPSAPAPAPAAQAITPTKAGAGDWDEDLHPRGDHGKWALAESHEPQPNHIHADVRDHEGETMGYLSHPHDGTTNGIRAAHAEAKEGLTSAGHDWSSPHTRWGATDHTGEPRHHISHDGQQLTDVADPRNAQRGPGGFEAPPKKARPAPYPKAPEREDRKAERESAFYPKQAAEPAIPADLAEKYPSLVEPHAAAPEPEQHWYGMHNRPPAIGAIPKGNYDHKPHDEFRHGQISYGRPLTEKEQYDYELTPIRNDSEIPALARGVAERMGPYVAKYLAPGAEKLLNGFLRHGQSAKDLGHVDPEKIKAELRKQHGSTESTPSVAAQEEAPVGKPASDAQEGASDGRESVSNDTLFKRSGQQFEEIQKSLGITKPQMGQQGADAVRKALASRVGGPVIAEMLKVHEHSPDAFARHGFATGTEAYRDSLSGKFSKEQLLDASRFAAGHENGDMSRFVRDSIRGATATDGGVSAEDHARAHQAGSLDRLAKSQGADEAKATKRQADDLMVPSPPASGDANHGSPASSEADSEWNHQHSDQEKGYREQERTFSEVMNDPSKSSLRDLTLAYGQGTHLMRHWDRRAERGEITAQQRDDHNDGMRRELDHISSLQRDYINGRKAAPADDMSRAEKIAEEAYHSKTPLESVARNMGLTKSEWHDERAAASKLHGELSQYDGEPAQPSKARAKAMASQQAKQAAEPLPADIAEKYPSLVEPKPSHKHIPLYQNPPKREGDLEVDHDPDYHVTRHADRLNDAITDAKESGGIDAPSIQSRHRIAKGLSPDEMTRLGEHLGIEDTSPRGVQEHIQAQLEDAISQHGQNTYAAAGSNPGNRPDDSSGAERRVKAAAAKLVELDDKPFSPYWQDKRSEAKKELAAAKDEMNRSTNAARDSKPEAAKPFRPEAVPGQQMGMFGEERSGQKQLFNVVKPKRGDKPQAVAPSELERIGDEIDARQAERQPLPGQKSIAEPEDQEDEKTFPSQSEVDFAKTLAQKHGSPVSPVTSASGRHELASRFSNMLERAAGKSTDELELEQILSAAKGKTDESRVAWAIANNPHSSDAVFEKAKANEAMREMSPDSAISHLDARRAELRKNRGLAAPSQSIEEQYPSLKEPPAGDIAKRVSNDEFADGDWDQAHSGLASEIVQSKMVQGMKGIEGREYGMREHSPGKWQMVSRPGKTAEQIKRDKPSTQREADEAVVSSNMRSNLFDEMRDEKTQSDRKEKVSKWRGQYADSPRENIASGDIARHDWEKAIQNGVAPARLSEMVEDAIRSGALDAGVGKHLKEKFSVEEQYPSLKEPAAPEGADESHYRDNLKDIKKHAATAKAVANSGVNAGHSVQKMMSDFRDNGMMEGDARRTILDAFDRTGVPVNHGDAKTAEPASVDHKEAELLRQQIAKLEGHAEKLDKGAASLKAKEYKPNSGRITKLDQFGEEVGTQSIGDVNERRRSRSIDLSSHQSQENRELVAKLKGKLAATEKRIERDAPYQDDGKTEDELMGEWLKETHPELANKSPKAEPPTSGRENNAKIIRAEKKISDLRQEKARLAPGLKIPHKASEAELGIAALDARIAKAQKSLDQVKAESGFKSAPDITDQYPSLKEPEAVAKQPHEMTKDEYVRQLPEGEEYQRHAKEWAAISGDKELRRLSRQQEEHGWEKPPTYSDRRRKWDTDNSRIEAAISSRVASLGLPPEAEPMVRVLTVREAQHNKAMVQNGKTPEQQSIDEPEAVADKNASTSAQVSAKRSTAEFLKTHKDQVAKRAKKNPSPKFSHEAEAEAVAQNRAAADARQAAKSTADITQQYPSLAEPKAEDSAATEPAHKQYDIYETHARNHPDGARTMHAVAMREDGKRGFGDTLHNTHEEAVAHIEHAKVAAKNKQEWQAKVAADEADKEKAKAEKNDLGGYESTLSAASRGKAVEHLDKLARLDGKDARLKDHVKRLVEAGEVTSTRDEDKVKPMTRTQFNRADNAQQEAHEKKMKAGGTKTNYLLGGWNVGKLAHDYANHLIAKKGAADITKQYPSLAEPKAKEPHEMTWQEIKGGHASERAAIPSQVAAAESEYAQARSGFDAESKKSMDRVRAISAKVRRLNPTGDTADIDSDSQKAVEKLKSEWDTISNRLRDQEAPHRSDFVAARMPQSKLPSGQHEHRTLVAKAISDGKIASHPDYPELSEKDEQEPEMNGWSPENHVKVAADSIQKLRGQDVHRLLDSAPPEGMEKMAKYILKHRPELVGDIRDAKIDIQDERGQQFSREEETCEGATCSPREALVKCLHECLNHDGQADIEHEDTDGSIESMIPADPSQLDRHVAETIRTFAEVSPKLAKALAAYQGGRS